ncbi:tyrosine-protein phosphatase [Streptomyces sp. NBC_00893]|uniref:tyrosine-protein phosphatase n=1 Tax=Streptomyces sp. NBC_00893 TaxID=2975862 RepID=UPI00224FF5D8|nr:tyrosine-protein phosphatase [Streptomyces sp. NBC_00893]MCX4850451.1 tyrosine-protein phosphatase [Streptomyces sp. NBC_00893]
MSGTRAVPLTLCNFRDLGGVVCADGQSLPSGLLFRSEAPAPQAQGDVECLRRLGVRTFVDLRSPEETSSSPPDRAAPGSYVSAGLRRVDWEDRDVPPDRMAGFLAERYLRLAEEGLGGDRPVGRALTALLDPSRTGRIVWCAGGKDRTGIVVAVLLHLLGASHEAIAADYARSAEASAELRRRARRDAATGAAPTRKRDPAERRRMLRASAAAFPGGVGALANPAPPEAITLFLTQLDRRHDGIQRYAERAGLDAEAIPKMRRTLFSVSGAYPSSTA